MWKIFYSEGENKILVESCVSKDIIYRDFVSLCSIM